MELSDSAKAHNVAQLMRQGKSAAQAGRRAEARRFFEAALQLDPDNEEATLWWAGLAGSLRSRLAALDRVLAINPHNRRAQKGLRDTRHRLAQPSRAVPGDDKAAQSFPTAEPSRVGGSRKVLFVGLLVLFVAISGVLIAATFSDAPRAVWAAFAPTATLSYTLTPTATFTATPTISPTATPTPAPTATPTPPPTLTVAVPVVSPAPVEGKWIDIDLSEQRLAAYVGSVPVYAVRVSTGLSHTPTKTGQYHIYRKYASTTMSGPGYSLPAVPWTMYYDGSYAVHGTYWHDNFGQPMSHGCVNLPTPDAKWLFDWAPEGTLVIIHR